MELFLPCGVPLYKSEDKLMVENYRPISVLPVSSKSMERVVHNQMSAYLDRLDWIRPDWTGFDGHQYGFRRGHNTTQAVEQSNNWVLEVIWMGANSLACYLKGS